MRSKVFVTKPNKEFSYESGLNKITNVKICLGYKFEWDESIKDYRKYLLYQRLRQYELDLLHEGKCELPHI